LHTLTIANNRIVDRHYCEYCPETQPRIFFSNSHFQTTSGTGPSDLECDQSGVIVEILVIDNSPEGSAQEVVERLRDSRLTYLTNPRPSGGMPSVVRNIGWPLARGDFIHFLDDEDIVPDGNYLQAKEAFLI
jgi:hypothetical protein